MQHLWKIVGVLLLSIHARAEMEACGKIQFDEKMNCEKPNVTFDISGCEKTSSGELASAKCSSETELTAVFRSSTSNYRVVLVKDETSKKWQQKGRVWKHVRAEGGEESTSDAKKSATREGSSETKVATAAAAAGTWGASAKAEIKSETEPEVKREPKPVKSKASKKAEAKGEPAKEDGTEEAKSAKKSDVKGDDSKDAEKSAAAVEAKQEETKSESSIRFKSSGFLQVEAENSRNFGYDGGSAIRNFDSSQDGSFRSPTALLGFFNFTLEKAGSSIVADLRIGDVYYGDSESGGNGAANKQNIKVRDFYLSTPLYEKTSVRAGIIPVKADARSFVLDDKYTGVSIDTELEKVKFRFWNIKNSERAPQLVSPQRDQMFGANVDLNLNETSEYSAFAMYRMTRETLVDPNDLTTEGSGKTYYTWLGGHGKWGTETSVEANAILNRSQFRGDSLQNDDTFSGLGHVNVRHELAMLNSSVSLDLLATTGADDVVATGKTAATIGRRQNFKSVSSNANLLSIATADGSDDAVGVTKESTIANLNFNQGLQIAVLTYSQKLGEKLTGFVRYGFLQSAAKNIDTGSRAVGSEIDINLKYQLHENAFLQFDYGQFGPGDFFQQKDFAELVATRIQVEF